MMHRGGWDFPGEDYLPPATVIIDGKEIKAGDRVRLHPRKRGRADVFDFVLEGKIATVEVIQQDFENRLYLVVTVDDDPAHEHELMNDRIIPGHNFFFFPEEVELLEGSEETP